MDHDEENCPHCVECPGCGGGDGSDPRNPVLDFSRPGVVLLICGDCTGGFVCSCGCHAVPATQ